MGRISNMTKERINEINREFEVKQRRTDIIKNRAKNMDFDLDKLFSIIFKDSDRFSDEDLTYYPERYPNDYEDFNLELNVFHVFMKQQAYKREDEPFYTETMFGRDYFFRWRDALYYCYEMHGQGSIFGIVKGDSDERDVNHCLNIDTMTIEPIDDTDEMAIDKSPYDAFSDIPQFIGSGNYHVNVEIHRLSRYLKGLAEDYHLNLTPDFQRERVWTTAQKQSYIEYILHCGITGRDLYFNCPDFAKERDGHSDLERLEVVCVDGLQRITAILEFFEDKFKVFGKYASEFKGRPSYDQSRLNIHINGLTKRKELLQWYIQLNTTGKPHTEEEIDKVRQMIDELDGE